MIKSVDQFLKGITTNGKILQRLQDFMKEVTPDVIVEMRMPEIEEGLDKLVRGEPLNRSLQGRLVEELKRDPSFLDELIISAFLTHTTFEALISAKMGKMHRWKDILLKLPKDEELRMASVNVVSEWSINNPARGMVESTKDVLRAIMIQRAVRRLSEKLGDVVLDMVKEELIKANITYQGPDVVVPGIRKKVDLCIPTTEDPKVLVEVKFHNSHGTKQKLDADEIEEIKNDAKQRYGNLVEVFAIVDGAGWYHRQRDLGRILSAADGVFQLRDLRKFTDRVSYLLKVS
mgnify:CR=1 FL=1